MNDFYTDGEYLKNNPEWDSADAPWKVNQLFNLLYKNNILEKIKSISEVGCGSGDIMVNLSRKMREKDIEYFGFDISPDAINIANKNKEKNKLNNFEYKILSIPDIKSDLLLCIDVFEHVENPFEFLRNIKDKGKYKIFNIPLDLSVQSLLREHIILSQRKRVGHVNYYTKNLALETLKDCGYEIIDIKYGEWYKHYLADSFVTKVVNVFRNFLMPIIPDFCVKFLGGSSLIVLAK